MSFDADESSVQDSQPVEGYKIELPTVTYFATSGMRDVAINGDTYTATTIARGAAVVSGIDGTNELEIHLPVSHPVAQRYLANGIPPRDVKITVLRKQLRSGTFSQWWKGYATAIAVEGRVATLRLPPLSADLIKRKLPTLGASSRCSHQLYDAQCQFPRASAQISTTIASLSGVLINATSMAPFLGTDQFARFGEVVHVPTGERRSIYDQVGNQLTVQMPIPEAIVGDAILIYAGCDKTIDGSGTGPASGTRGCAQFNNVVNFGGVPDLPAKNPFAPGSLGWVRT